MERLPLKFFRLESPERGTATEAFSGKGGLYVAGRWNSLGHLAVYVSESISLAYLEVLTRLRKDRPPNKLYLLYDVEIPDEMIEVPAAIALPNEWDSRPPGPASREFGDLWLKEKRSPALLVPSVIVRQEHNAIINPLHPQFKLRWVKGPRIFQHDSRLG